jgi:hypothetical protein
MRGPITNRDLRPLRDYPDPEYTPKNESEAQTRDLAYVLDVLEREGLSRSRPLMNQPTRGEPRLAVTFTEDDGSSLTINSREASGDHVAFNTFKLHITATPGQRKGTLEASVDPAILGECWSWRSP